MPAACCRGQSLWMRPLALCSIRNKDALCIAAGPPHIDGACVFGMFGLDHGITTTGEEALPVMDERSYTRRLV